MKNKMQRLTALLLALMMIFGMLAASAESLDPGSMSLDDWTQLVDNAMQKLFNIHEGGSGKTITPPKEQLPSNPSAPYQNSNGYYLSQGQVSMGTSDVVTLTSSTAGQWQIQVGTMWVNLAGETDNTLTVTYAMLANTNSVNYAVRQVDAQGSVIGTMVFDVTESVLAERPQVATLSTETRGDDGVSILSSEDANSGDGTNVKKTYSILVDYQFEDGKQAADSYTGTIAEGSAFSATVTFPTVVGYLPYLGNATESTTSLAINISSMSEDVKYTVTYKPTLVNYTVIHYKQNVNDDYYTIVETETRQGLTASQVDEVAHVYTKTVDNVTTTVYNPDTNANKKDYEGFYSLIYERPNIAADGSTVIEVYYDRYYYLMNFDMDGGYGTDPVYARYGASIGTVTAPTKAGYTFLGWSETKGETSADKAVTLPTTMPAENKTYYAIWEVGETAKVTVVFWGENADDEEYSYLSDKTKVINLKPGIPFTYSESEMLVCNKEVHTHSDNCLGCGKTEHTHSAVGGRCYTLTCTIESHKHDTTCYANVGNQNNFHPSAPSNPSNGQVYHSDGILGAGSYTIIYIDGTWYNYTGSTSSGSIAPTTCGKEETTHTHTDSCYTLTCTAEEHTHSDSCYTCGKTEHTHNSDCYMQGAGLDSNLWVFEKSDTVTVAADGSTVVNVYYKRTEKTLTFKYSYSRNSYQKTETITAKWGQNIATEYNAIVKNAGSSFWSANSNYSSPYTNYFGVMPQQSKTYYYQSDNGRAGTMYYYGEDLDGNYVEMFSVSNVGGYTVTDEDHYEFKGFTYDHGTANKADCADAKFYYSRNSYKLTFNDQYSDVKTETVKYEAPLERYYFEPDVPEGKYEPGSVEFGGWYLNPQCSDDAKYDLSTHKMPASDLILYAKWVPVEHTVKFYLTEQSTDIYKPVNADKEASFTVSHGGNIAEEYVKNHLEKSAMNEAKPNGDYTFVMWYYKEGEDKIPFDPTTQIRKDLTLYGEWSSNTLKPYTVQYVLAEKTDNGIVVQKDADGNPIKVADDLTGSGLAGTTKTFDAKGGTELYAAYQEGYFPTVQSQSLLLDIAGTPETLTVPFYYVAMPAVPYTVRYVEKDTGKTLADDKVVSDNRKAVVTETFQPISDYMPDAYQKRLVVTADGENTLYFYYSKDETHAYYKITHYTQNTDGKTWTEYASSQAVGNIGETYRADPMTIPGFTYAKEYDNGTDKEVKSGKLTANGLELKLYYVRNEYPYQVRYLEQGSGTVLHDPKDGTGKYGEVISESAIDIDGYDKVDPTSATLNIRIDEGEGAPNINIITFYYKEKEVPINYKVVGPDGCGSVSPTTETVKVMSGTAQGSTPTAGENFRFVGWYKDEECTQPVEGEGWLDGNKIVPQKTTTIAVNGKDEDAYAAATYYAKFEVDKAKLTITKTGMDKGESAIFNVSGPGYNGQVVVPTGGSVTLFVTCGEYTITEVGAWSNRYTCSSSNLTNGKVTVTAGGVTVSFTNTKSNDQWLHDESGVINNFGTDEKKDIN